jgi:hypothetical protein
MNFFFLPNRDKCRPDEQGNPSPVQQRDLNGWEGRAKTKYQGKSLLVLVFRVSGEI